MMLPTRQELEVERLGNPIYASPLRAHERFIDEQDRILVSDSGKVLSSSLQAGAVIPSFERAGPRETLFFHPARTRCAIVTCGGLCPGENDVIRSIVLTLVHSYGIHQILGIRYGYAGLTSAPPEPPIELTPALVEGAHEVGGSLLGSSCGTQNISDMVDVLGRWKVDALFVLGGAGALRSAAELTDEIARRQLGIAVVGVPKIIDNDLGWIDQSVGFSTALEGARRAIAAAHIEAKVVWNGVGVVELMGRHSGFIAAHACLSNPHVNFCLVPEVPFPMDGECGLLWALERRLEARHHAVLVVAEGATRAHLQPASPEPREASGNVRLAGAGAYLRERIEGYFAARHQQVSVKCIDPGYLIRSSPANAADAELCLRLGQHAVHAALVGRTRLLVGSWHGQFAHIPLGLATQRRRQIDAAGPLWQSVLEATGQHRCLLGQRPCKEGNC